MYASLETYVASYLRAVALIFAGLFAAGLLAELGALRYLAKPMEPLARAAKLPVGASAFLTLRIIEPTSSHGALASLIRRGEVDERGAVAAILVASAPVRAGSFLRYYLPVVVPILGVSLGLKYAALALLSSAMVTAAGIAYGRLALGKAASGSDAEAGIKQAPRPSLREASAKALREAASFAGKVAARLAVAIAAVAALTAFGAFELIGALLEPVLKPLSLPLCAAAAISAYVASPIAGLCIIGELFRSGALSEGEALAAAIIGSIAFAAFVDYPRGVYPLRASIYGPKLAAKLVAADLSAFVLANIAILCLLYAFAFP